MQSVMGTFLNILAFCEIDQKLQLDQDMCSRQAPMQLRKIYLYEEVKIQPGESLRIVFQDLIFQTLQVQRWSEETMIQLCTNAEKISKTNCTSPANPLLLEQYPTKSDVSYFLIIMQRENN